MPQNKFLTTINVDKANGRIFERINDQILPSNENLHHQKYNKFAHHRNMSLPQLHD